MNIISNDQIPDSIKPKHHCPKHGEEICNNGIIALLLQPIIYKITNNNTEIHNCSKLSLYLFKSRFFSKGWREVINR